MGGLAHLVAANGGVVSTAQLRADGWSHARLATLPAHGWVKVRRGWYAVRSADPQVVRAVSAGGVLGCVSALRLLGVWVPDSALHIRYSTRARRGRRSCHPYRTDPPAPCAVDPIDIAVASAANCLDAEDLVVVLDSMLNLRMIEMADARAILAASRSAHLNLADRCDATSESGTETMVRLRLRSRGIRLRTQVPIPGVGRVDFLVGERLIIEVDSRQHHLPKYQADRTRDRVAIGMGYLVIRLTYEDVMHRWDVVCADILSVVRRRAHRGPVAMSG